MDINTLQVQMDFNTPITEHAIEAAYLAVSEIPGVVSVDMAFTEQALSMLIQSEDPELDTPAVSLVVVKALIGSDAI